MASRPNSGSWRPHTWTRTVFSVKHLVVVVVVTGVTSFLLFGIVQRHKDYPGTITRPSTLKKRTVWISKILIYDLPNSTDSLLDFFLTKLDRHDSPTSSKCINSLPPGWYIPHLLDERSRLSFCILLLALLLFIGDRLISKTATSGRVFDPSASCHAKTKDDLNFPQSLHYYNLNLVSWRSSSWFCLCGAYLIVSII